MTPSSVGHHNSGFSKIKERKWCKANVSFYIRGNFIHRCHFYSSVFITVRWKIVEKYSKQFLCGCLFQHILKTKYSLMISEFCVFSLKVQKIKFIVTLSQFLIPILNVWNILQRVYCICVNHDQSYLELS